MRPRDGFRVASPGRPRDHSLGGSKRGVKYKNEQKVDSAGIGTRDGAVYDDSVGTGTRDGAVIVDCVPETHCESVLFPGSSVTDPSDRRHQPLGRRSRQRARRRDACRAARCAREQTDEGAGARAPTDRPKRSHQSNRKQRRQRLRAEHRRSAQRRQTVDDLLRLVNQTGGTAYKSTTLSLVRDWRHATPHQPSLQQGVSNPVSDTSPAHLIAVQHPAAEAVHPTRTVDDGILLMINIQLSGKTARALIDSGASRSFVSPETVVRVGLHSIGDTCLLELANGQKILSHGKIPQALVQIATSSSKINLTISPLLQDVDVILGMDWLQLVNPLIDWATPRVVFPQHSGESAAIGTWLDSSHAVGQIRLIDDSFFVLPPSRLLPPQAPLDIDVLASPSFWTYSPSAHGWTRASSGGNGGAVPVDRTAQDDEHVVTSPPEAQSVEEQPQGSPRLRSMTKVAGKRSVKTQSKASRQRQLLSAKGLEKLVKRGEQIFLAVVKRTESVDRGTQTRSRGRVGAVQSKKMLSRQGPKKDFISVEQRREDVLKQVAPENRSQLQEILRDFQDVFPEKLPAGMPPQRPVELEIREEPDSKPPSRPPYRLSPVEQEELETQLQDLLAQGFVRPSVSPYGAPVLFAPKKDGRWRMCIDYRALNKQTVKDKFPLPRIDELLESLGKARVFTALDLASGYHQIGIAEDSIEKTAFRTARGQYEFVVMPFGLTNAPSVFQRLMNKLFRDELGIFVLVYLDDILIYSEDLDSHWAHLRQVLQRLRESQLYGRLHKCEFLKDRVQYLGFDVSAEGIRPSDDKVKTILEWPTPTSQKDIRSFLGLCSFYRRFVRGFSSIAHPLTELTREKTPWVWEQDQQRSFAQLKVAMTTAPVLIFPDFDREFVLTTDASLTAVGGILQQDHGRGLQPIAFASKKLNAAEIRYSAYERELLGIVWAVGQWRHYLQGRRFVVQTDHSSLKHLPNQAAIHRRIWKWMSILQSYDIEIRHIPGTRNPADPLSRQHQQEDQRLNAAAKEEEARLVDQLQLSPDATDDQIQAALDSAFQRFQSSAQSSAVAAVKIDEPTDFSDLPTAQCLTTRTTIAVSAQLRQRMQELLETETPYSEILDELDQAPISAQEVRRGVEVYRIRHHSLCIHRPDFAADHQYWKIIVPDNQQLKQQILTETHAVPYAGHPGYHRTLETVRRTFYWRGMAADVREFILQCPVCQVEKGERQLPRGSLQPIHIPEKKWTEVTMDFITKMPVTQKNNDAVLVVVDRATKMVHLIPCSESISAHGTAFLYWEHVAKIHGIPKCINTDRDRRFESRFWRSLWQLMGTSLHMSTAYHPQTQGQVERVNSVFEQVLRCVVHQLGEPRDWDDLCPVIEFSLNSHPNRSTGFSPFYLNFGYHPVTPADLLTCEDESSVESVSRFTQRLHSIFAKAKEHLHVAQEQQRRYYDRRHRPAEFDVGQYVLLSTKNLRIRGTPAKLQRRFVGPFKILERIGNQAYRLQLPDGWNIHPTFHVTLLKAWQRGQWTQETAADPIELQAEGDDEFEIERLLRWRRVTVGRRRIREFLILWRGWPLDDATWVREDDITPETTIQDLIDRDQPIEDMGGASGSGS